MEPVVQADYAVGRDERGGELATTPAEYRVTRELLRDNGETDAIILHSPWTSFPPTSTARATSATGSRRSTAS